MKKGLTELVFILDRSGSMSGLEADTVGGFNSMIRKQKHQEGDALVTTVLFNGASEMIHDRENIQRIAPMTEADYTPSGCTALLDAMGETIRHISEIHRYIRTEDVPEHTMFIITTDGMENASHRETIQSVRRLVEQQKEAAGWEFLFLGANIDAVETAGSFGIGADHAVKYCCDSVGTAVNFEAMNDAVSAMRCCRPIDGKWKEKIEKDYEKRRR